MTHTIVTKAQPSSRQLSQDRLLTSCVRESTISNSVDSASRSSSVKQNIIVIALHHLP